VMSSPSNPAMPTFLIACMENLQWPRLADAMTCP